MSKLVQFTGAHFADLNPNSRDNLNKFLHHIHQI